MESVDLVSDSETEDSEEVRLHQQTFCDQCALPQHEV